MVFIKEKSVDITSCQINENTKIVYDAFRGCSGLISIEIFDSITAIAGASFYECSSLQYNEYDNAYYLGNADNPYVALIKAKSTDIGSCKINENTKVIQDGAFGGCENLTDMEIPNGVIYIGAWAFQDCSSLSSIKIPYSVTSIGDHTFSGCSSLTNIEIPDSVTYIGASIFEWCDNLTSITLPFIGTTREDSSNAYLGYNFGASQYDNSGYVPASLQTVAITAAIDVPSGAFASCYNLMSVLIGDSVASIGNYSFASCYNLTSVEIGNSVSSIGNDAFSGCRSLTSINIPNSVTSIGDWAFSGCSSLTIIEIPNGVTSIGDWAFKYCNGLTSIDVNENNECQNPWRCGFYW